MREAVRLTPGIDFLPEGSRRAGQYPPASRARGGWSPALVGTGPNIALVNAFFNLFGQKTAECSSLDCMSEKQTFYFENLENLPSRGAGNVLACVARQYQSVRHYKETRRRR